MSRKLNGDGFSGSKNPALNGILDDQEGHLGILLGGGFGVGRSGDADDDLVGVATGAIGVGDGDLEGPGDVGGTGEDTVIVSGKEVGEVVPFEGGGI